MIAYSRAQKRKARKGKRAMFAQIEAREQEIRMSIEQREHDDPLRTVREARARQLRMPERDVMVAMYGEDAGRAIASEAVNEAEAKRLWEKFMRFDDVDAAYFRRIIGRPRFPNVAKMEFLPERVETNPDEKRDDRDDDTKDRDAVNGWMTWQGYLGHLASHERSAIVRAARQMDELHRDGKATVHGQAFVRAMRVLVPVVDAAERRR